MMRGSQRRIKGDGGYHSSPHLNHLTQFIHDTTNMPSIRSTLVALAITATAIALPRPQDPSDPVGQPLPTFPGDGISYIGSASGTITAYAYAPDGPAYGCLDATGHVTKSAAACATFVATQIANSTYGSTIATSNGLCAFNPNDQYKFQCKDLGDVKPTSFYVSQVHWHRKAQNID